MEEGIWVGQDGKKLGPYSEADVRHWVTEGRFSRDAVAWRPGMPDWVPLATLLQRASAAPPPTTPPPTAPPPVAPPPAASRPATYAASEPRSNDWAGGMDERWGEQPQMRADRRSLPTPPSLHWGLVVLFTILTLGIFGVVWPFIQAGWVRRIDDRSNAKTMLGLGVTCYFLGYFLIRAGLPSAEGDGLHPGMIGLGLLLMLSNSVLFIAAFFSMAGSIRREMEAYRVPVEIGGVTLFFFNVWYLQSQLSWLARWQRTGQTTPKPSKGVFWALLGIPFVAGVLAAVALPAYQEYVLRSQIVSVLSQAEPLKAQIVESIGRNNAWPRTNAQAGLRAANDYANGNLAGFAVQELDEGTALVAVFNERAPVALRNKRLALLARGQDGAIVWTCESPDINQRYLPMQCR